MEDGPSGVQNMHKLLIQSGGLMAASESSVIQQLRQQLQTLCHLMGKCMFLL